jgi:glycosyltransferase involved in cell wall biosynthesis
MMTKPPCDSDISLACSAPRPNAKNNPLVSVIIPTRNSAATLSRCLESLKDQTYTNVEIIVVDNNSADNTIDIARLFMTRIFTMTPERSSQVNYGVSMASGKYVYRVDSDFVLEPGVIAESVALSESNNYAAILIHNTSDPTVSFWSKVRKFERDMYLDSDLNVAVRFMRRDAFISVGGMDTRLNYGEDYDLHNRIVREYENSRIGKITSKELHVGEYKSIKEIASRNYYYGKSAGLFLKKNRMKGISQVNPFRMVYLKNYVEFVTHPDMTAGFLIYQIVRYSSGLIGLLVCKIRN